VAEEGNGRTEGVAEEALRSGGALALRFFLFRFSLYLGSMFLDRARPPRLTWVALKPTGLPVGSS